MARSERSANIKRRRKRRSTLARLRTRYASAKTAAERQKLLTKLKRVAPTVAEATAPK